MPAARRRFIVMLWLSLALHALVIGLTQLPSPVRVLLPPDLRVEIAEPAPAAQATLTTPEPTVKPPARVPQPAPPARQVPPRLQATDAPLPQAVSPPMPASQAAPAAPSVPAPSRKAPGPVLDVPLLVDTRYYTAKELDVQPFALRRPEPVYPVRAEEQDVAGRVLIRLHLEADGSISRTEVVSVAPGGAFGEMFRKATLDSLAGVRFKPAQRNGQPVRAVVEIPVVFEPDG